MPAEKKRDPDKELKAALDRLPYPKWKQVFALINGVDDMAPAKPANLNFNALGAKMKSWSMSHDTMNHALKMALQIFKPFGQDAGPFLHFGGLMSSMRELVANDDLESLEGVIQLCKDKGENPREVPQDAQWSLLSFAAYLGRAEIVKMLLGKQGCFPVKLIDEKDEQGCTPLIWAAASGSVDTARVLIDHNADMNLRWNEKETPLMIAACRGHAKVVRLLIDRDADVLMVDENKDRHGDGWGPLQKACWWGHDEVLAELLLEHKDNPAFEKTMRAAARLQGHTHITELLDGKRGPRSFPRVSLKLFFSGGGNQADLRREVRTVLSQSLQNHNVGYGDVAVPDIEDVDKGMGKGKIAHCEIRIRSSTVVGVWRDLNKKLHEADSPIRKSGKLKSDPEQSECVILWPMSKMSEVLSQKIAEEVKKCDDPVLQVPGKKNPLAELDLNKAPSEILESIVVAVRESVELYEGVTRQLETSEPDAMSKLRAIQSQGRYFVEEFQAAAEAIQAAVSGKLKDEAALAEKLRPLAKRNTKINDVLKKYDWSGENFEKPPKLDALLKAMVAERDVKEDDEDDEDDLGENKNKEEMPKQVISTLMPHVEAKQKELTEDTVQHFQTTDDRKRYEVQFHNIKAKQKEQEDAKPTTSFDSKTIWGLDHLCEVPTKTKQPNFPADVLLAPQFTPRYKRSEKKEVNDEDGKESAPVTRELPEVRKAAQIAQKKLKGLFVPKSEWAAADLNNPNNVPLDDPQREIRDQGLVLGGCCTDPGIKNAARIREKALGLNPEAPDYTQIVDISRLGVNFDTVEALLKCLEILIQKADICWIDNKFRSPSPLGYSDVNVGVRITLPGEKSYICEVQFSVDLMFAAKMNKGHAYYEKMRSSLSDLQIPEHLQDPLLRFIISLLHDIEGDL